MRRVGTRPLWLGHAGDARDPLRLNDLGIAALVDLARDEPPTRPSRDLIYCRFPLVDGARQSPDWLIRVAVETGTRTP